MAKALSQNIYDEWNIWNDIANAIFWLSLILILLKFNVLSFRNGHLGITSRQHKPKCISMTNIFGLFNIEKWIIFKVFIKNILDIDALHTFINIKMIFNSKSFLKGYFCSIFLHYESAFKKELFDLGKFNVFWWLWAFGTC